jgi:hypothetical protein
LKTDGTVVYAIGDVQGERHLEQLREWSDIISVHSGASAGGTEQFFGIRSDGTIVYTYLINGENPTFDSWTDIVDLSMDNRIVVGLKSDGTVVGFSDGIYGSSALVREIESWTNIIEVHALEFLSRPAVFGLRSDGTVVFTGSDLDLEYLNSVRNWTDIVSIHCDYTSRGGHGNIYVIGLKSDGTVVFATDEDASIDSEYITDWTDIIEISASSIVITFSTGARQNIAIVGLKSDGTVVSTTSNDDDQFRRRRTRDWENVISVSSSDGHSFFRISADGDSVLHYSSYIGSSGAYVMSDGTVRLAWDGSDLRLKPEGVENWTGIRTTPVIR